MGCTASIDDRPPNSQVKPSSDLSSSNSQNNTNKSFKPENSFEQLLKAAHAKAIQERDHPSLQSTQVAKSNTTTENVERINEETLNHGGPVPRHRKANTETDVSQETDKFGAI